MYFLHGCCDMFVLLYRPLSTSTHLGKIAGESRIHAYIFLVSRRFHAAVKASRHPNALSEDCNKVARASGCMCTQD